MVVNDPQNSSAPATITPATPPGATPVSMPTKSRLKDYILVILGVILAASVAILGVMLTRPKSDNTTLVVAIIGFSGVVVPVLINLIKSEDNAAASRMAIQEVHFSLNSRLTEWMESEKRHADAAAAAARLEGRAEGTVAASLSQETILAIQAAVEHVMNISSAKSTTK